MTHDKEERHSMPICDLSRQPRPAEREERVRTAQGPGSIRNARDEGAQTP